MLSNKKRITIVWALLVLGVAILLMVGVERLMARLGVRCDEASQDGLSSLAERLERSASERIRRD